MMETHDIMSISVHSYYIYKKTHVGEFIASRYQSKEHSECGPLFQQCVRLFLQI